AWSVWVLAFFTTSASRLEYYALPAFPALAVIVAAYWRRAIDARPAPAGARVAAWIVLGIGVALVPRLVSSRESTAEFLPSLLTLLDGVYRDYLVVYSDLSFAVVALCQWLLP